MTLYGFDDVCEVPCQPGWIGFVLQLRSYVDVTLAGLEGDYRCNRHCEGPVRAVPVPGVLEL